MSEVQAESKVKKAATVYNSVKMDDGRIVDFPGKRRLLKNSEVSKDGFTVTTTFDFVHGESRSFTIEANHALFAQFCAHGIEQKIGDEVAGLEDPEDMVEAVDAIIERLQAGEWAAKRESSGMAGISVLGKALVKVSGKTAEQIREFLKGKSNAEKLALRNSPKLAPVIAELEANKKRKPKAEVDTESLLGELGA
jgi:hypothetical protein